MANITKVNESVLNSEPIDQMVQHLQKKYVDKTDEIIDLPLFSDLKTKTFKKRVELEKWILDPTSNVTVIIAFSGGKDSVAMVLKALDIGIPKERIELWVQSHIAKPSLRLSGLKYYSLTDTRNSRKSRKYYEKR